jgi:hypothetical protein
MDTSTQIQDDLRPLRMFVGALQGALAGDQSVYGMDAYAWSVPGQYQVIGPTGVGLEGRPISTTQNGGLYISPGIVLMGLGALAFFVMQR